MMNENYPIVTGVIDKSFSVSPRIETVKTETGYDLIITDINGKQTISLKDGAKGSQGIPTVIIHGLGNYETGEVTIPSVQEQDIISLLFPDGYEEGAPSGIQVYLELDGMYYTTHCHLNNNVLALFFERIFCEGGNRLYVQRLCKDVSKLQEEVWSNWEMLYTKLTYEDF